MLSLIGQVKIDGKEIDFASCTIQTSYDHDTDTATVVLPTQNDVKSNDLEEKNINILLGYKNRVFNVEFSGTVTEVSSGAPTELTCHSHIHSLRQIRLNKRFSKKALSKILKYAVKDVASDVIVNPDIKITSHCYWKTARWFISHLAKHYGYVIEYDSYTLSFKKPYQEVNEELPVYDETFNVINTSVKLRVSKGVSRVQVFSENEKGQRIKASYPSKQNSKNEKQVVIEGLSSSRDCFSRAKEIYQELNAEGLEGEMTTFGYPYVKPGQTVALKSINNHTRGVYHIDNMETTFGTEGFRRKITLGSKSKTKFPEDAVAVL